MIYNLRVKLGGWKWYYRFKKPTEVIRFGCRTILHKELGRIKAMGFMQVGYSSQHNSIGIWANRERDVVYTVFIKSQG